MFSCVSKKVETVSQKKIITSRPYWEEITLKISEELKKNSIMLLDCYIFGSGKGDKLLANISDIDSIMILNGNYSDAELIRIRRILDVFLRDVDIFNKYHFRIFDKFGFFDLANYDGYRLFELQYQYDNYSFCGTDILFQRKPNLNSDNFNISYLTQLVYGSLMDRDIFEFKATDKKSEYRLNRNREINTINGIELDENETNSLLKEYTLLRNNLNQSIFDWKKFLSKYYRRVKHEYINKSETYDYNLRMYIC